MFIRVASVDERSGCCKDSPQLVISKENGEIIDVSSGVEKIFKIGNSK